jgi:hypothetical protein
MATWKTDVELIARFSLQTRSATRMSAYYGVGVIIWSSAFLTGKSDELLSITVSQLPVIANDKYGAVIACFEAIPPSAANTSLL